MNLKDTMKGALIAGAVTALFVAGPAVAKGKAAKKAAAGVMCAGTNECKGKGACKGADNACKGKNECKGKGVMSMKTDKDCTDKGGTVAVAPPAATK